MLCILTILTSILLRTQLTGQNCNGCPIPFHCRWIIHRKVQKIARKTCLERGLLVPRCYSKPFSKYSCFIKRLKQQKNQLLPGVPSLIKLMLQRIRMGDKSFNVLM